MRTTINRASTILPYVVTHFTIRRGAHYVRCGAHLEFPVEATGLITSQDLTNTGKKEKKKKAQERRCTTSASRSLTVWWCWPAASSPTRGKAAPRRWPAASAPASSSFSPDSSASRRSRSGGIPT